MGVLAFLAVVFSVLLLGYLAARASWRTLGIVLGAVVVLGFSGTFLSYQFRAPPSLDWAYPIGAVPDGTSVEEAVTAKTATSKISNKELWERLPKAQINLDADPPQESVAVEEVEKDAERRPVKPGWVENPPKRIGNLYRRVVASDPYSTAEECYRQLEGLLQDAVRERIQTLTSQGTGASVLTPESDSFHIDLAYLMREICQDEFTETVSASFGEMKRVHVLMEFSPTVEKHLRKVWQEQERRYRLRVVGIFAAAALSLLASVYGLLRFDTWTRGDYTGRLLVGAAVVIIGTVALFLG